jgi:hypothetical protein
MYVVVVARAVVVVGVAAAAAVVAVHFQLTSALKEICGQCYKTFYGRNLQKFFNKLESFFPADLSSLVYCFCVTPRAYPEVEHLKGASF